jgi:hypothetical protein
MKPLDWILLLMSASGLYAFLAGLIFTPKIVFELMPGKAAEILRRRFYWFVIPGIILVWRIWG